MASLLSSIEEYKIQLDQVNTALALANDEEKRELQELQFNLLQALDLTLHQLEASQTNTPLQGQVSSGSSSIRVQSNFDEEFALFKSEIADLTKTDNESLSSNEPVEDDIICGEEEQMIVKLKTLEGEQVRAPFIERWGGYTYHNAVILSLALNEKNLPDFDNPKVLVLYNQPTNPSMLPCRFFLNGHCKFMEEKCKFSHGREVLVSDIKAYEKPDYESISSGSKVLALHKADIWHKGQIEDVLEDRSAFSFNCEVCQKVVEVNLESMVPLFADDDVDNRNKPELSLPEGEDQGSNELELEGNFVPNTMWLQSANDQHFGDWEKHTKGIASKLMAKMGYILGSGLGPKGEGKVDPVTAYVYPQGVSLDRCMELREASNGEEIMEVEKRLKKLQKREEEKQKKQAENLSQNASVFDIINTKLDGKSAASSSEGSKQRMDVSSKSLKGDSTRELNRKNLQLSCHVQKLRGEIKRLKQSKERQAKDFVTLRAIDSKLQEKAKELQLLRDAESKIGREQKERKDTKTSFVF